MNDASEPPRVDELLDQAFEAFSAGDRATAAVLAEQVLTLDEGNTEAEDLLAAPTDSGEIRRLTISFIDLVDSTALSTRIEPEIYRTVVGRYRDDVLRIVREYGGHVGSTKGDGLLAYFGHPEAHEDDASRAVQAGLDITRAVTDLSKRVRNRFGFEIDVRVGIHRGIVYLDTAQDDVYGLAANLTARICSIAAPGTVSVSDAIEPLVNATFELQARLPQNVKGIETPIRHFRVIAERDLTPIRLGPLIGRQVEQALLGQAWDKAMSNDLDQPGVLLLGDAGIGKSRLAWSVVDSAQRSHAVVLQLNGSPIHTDVGLRPFRRLLERQCGIGRESDSTERLQQLIAEIANRGLEVERMVPLLAPVLDIDPRAGYRPLAEEGRKLYASIATGVYDYLCACIRDSPSLLIAEDMHWFDEDTVELLQAVLNADLGRHVLVVMTSRDPVPGIEGKRILPIKLKPLTAAQSDQLAKTLYPDVDAASLRTVRKRCDGVPLYIEEVVAKLRNQPSDRAGEVPDSLYEALFARLRSSTDAVQVVEAAALMGSRVERNLLLCAVDLETNVVDDALEQLVAGRVLEPLEEGSWRFRHELLREVAAEISPPSHQRRIHSRIADALLASATGNPDWLLTAHHYGRAERFLESATAYDRASANAAQRGALGEARNHLSAAITQVELAPTDPALDRLEIGLRLRRALLAQAAESVASPNAAADFEKCLQLCSTDLDDDDMFSTVMSLYPYYTMRADLDRAERLVTSIRNSLTGPRAAFLPINELALGMLAFYRGEFATARTKFDLAADTSTRSAEEELESMLYMPNDAPAGLYTHRALSRCFDGDLEAVTADLQRAEQRCTELDFPKNAFSLAYLKQIEVLVRLEFGELDTAATVAADLTVLGEQHGFDSWAIVGAAQSAVVTALRALADGADPDQLRPHIQVITGFVDAWRAFNVIALITFYDAVLARLLIGAGDLAQARQRIETALHLADDTGMHFYDAELHRLRARCAEDSSRPQDLEAAIELARRQDARIFELRTAMDAFGSVPDRGTEYLRAALARFPSDSGYSEVLAARTLLE